MKYSGKQFFFVLIIASFLHPGPESLPLANLNDPKVFTRVKIINKIYNKLDPETYSRIIRISSDKVHTFALVPNEIIAEWKENKVPYVSLRPPQKFSEIDPDYQIRLKKGCVMPDRIMNGYRNYALNEMYLRCLEMQFRGVAERVLAGKTVQNRNITALKITVPGPVSGIESGTDINYKENKLLNKINSDNRFNKSSNPAEERDSVLVHCGIHGNEIISIEHCYDLIAEVLMHPENYPVLSKIHLWVIPMLNPDGVQAFWFNSMKQGRKNAAGVDLNRNFPFKWNTGNPKASSDNPQSVLYRGPFPASEPETRAVLSLFESERFVFSLSYHCFANSLLIPYSIENTVNPEPNILQAIGLRLIKGITVYRPDKEFAAKKNLYEVDGTDQDTFYNYFGTFAYVVESSHLIENYNHVPRIVSGLRPIWQNMLREYDTAWKIRLKVTDSAGRPLRALIQDDAYKYSENEMRYSNSKNGLYTFIAPDSSRVRMTIHAEGYKSVSLKIKPDVNPETMIISLLPESE